MFGPIGALAAILELIEYVELLFFLQVENSPDIGQKTLLCTPLAIYMLNIFGIQIRLYKTRKRIRNTGSGKLFISDDNSEIGAHV